MRNVKEAITHYARKTLYTTPLQATRNRENESESTRGIKTLTLKLNIQNLFSYSQYATTIF